MLQLYIAGHRVNLPEGVTTDFYSKNPFFTNSGNYTLDIDIPLSDPQNARLYGFADRIDRTKRMLRREAVLADEHGVLVRGREVVLEVTDGQAKIQIVGGASELNYITGDHTLQEIDLYVTLASNECEYVPVCGYNDTDGKDYNMMLGEQYVTEDNRKTLKWRIANTPRWWADGTLLMDNNVPQPYLWAVVRRVVEALGFTIGSSVLETDTHYNKILMIHAYQTRYLADMLPRWTVTKFFDEIQKFFNVIIDVDPASRTVNITNAWSYLSNTVNVIRWDDIVGKVEKQYGEDSGLTMVDYSAAHYAFTSRASNKYLDLDPELVSVCDKIPASSATPSDSGDIGYCYGIWYAMDSGVEGETDPTDDVEQQFGKRKIYSMTIDGETRYFVHWALDENYCALMMVDQFGRKTSTNPEATDVEIGIVPVRMATSPVIYGSNGVKFQYPLPAVDGEASSYHSVSFGADIATTNDDNINDDIKSGYKVEERDRADVIFAAYYLGQLQVSSWEPSRFNVPSTIKVPVAAPDYMTQLQRMKGDIETVFYRSSRNVRLGSGYLTMAINGQHGMNAYTYNLNPHVDTSVAYTIRFRALGDCDVRGMWNIANRLFYCKEIKWNIGAGRRSEVAEGIFFPILAAGTNEGGESVYNVSYTLDRVVVPHRIYSVVAGEPLEIDMTLDSGGSASATIMGVVTMGGVDITATALTVNARTATVYIAQVTGDVVIQASYNVPSAMTVRCTFENVTSNAPASVNSGSPLSVVLTGVNGNKVQENSVIVTMGGNDITSTAYNHATKTVSIARVTGNVSIKAVGRPYDAEVEWLQSDGSAYINTGVKVAPTLTFYLDIYLTRPDKIVQLFGGRESTTSNMLYFMHDSRTSGSIGAKWYYGNKILSMSLLSEGRHVFDNTADAKTLKIDGTNHAVSSPSFNATQIDFYIFTIHAGTGIASNNVPNGAKIFAGKMYSSGTQVRDYIPVRNNGIGYLYDKVSGQLFGNANSSGAFTYGNDV